MSNHEVYIFKNGRWGQNCYVVANYNHQALIIDPGSDFDGIQKIISDNNLVPLGVLNTHAHYDHIGAVSALIDRYEIPFYLSGLDRKLLRQANLYKFLFEEKDSLRIPEINIDLSIGPKIFSIGQFKVEVLETPGHTEGSVCFLIDNNLFSGDTLMVDGPGGVDLPGGDKSKLLNSLEILRGVSGNYRVYAGHGKSFNLREYWDTKHE